MMSHMVIVKNHVDTIVLVDDSIVRGTTLHDSVIRIVSRLHPRRIIYCFFCPTDPLSRLLWH